MAVLKAELSLARGTLPVVPADSLSRRQGLAVQYVDGSGRVRDQTGAVVGDFVADTLGIMSKRTSRYMADNTTQSPRPTAMRPGDYCQFPVRRAVAAGVGRTLAHPTSEAETAERHWGHEFTKPFIYRSGRGTSKFKEHPKEGRVS